MDDSRDGDDNDHLEVRLDHKIQGGERQELPTYNGREEPKRYLARYKPSY